MMKMNRKIAGLAICLLLLGGVLAVYITQQAEEVKVEVSQEVIAGLGRDPVGARGAHPYLTRVFEQLVMLDAEMKPRPGLSTSWEVSEDGLTWTIRLREDVKFHDGTPFNAEMAKFSLDWGTRVRPGLLGPVDRIEIVDDYTIKVIHSEPYAPFVRSLFFFVMISPAAIDEEDRVIESIGTGPFKVEDHQPGDKLVLIRNEDYWGGTPRLERVTLRYIPDPTTRVMALEAGEIDMIVDTGGILPEQVPILEANPEIEVMTIHGVVHHHIGFDTTTPPFDDVRVRKAISYAIDTESLVRYALEGYGTVMRTSVPPLHKDWMHPETLFEFNDQDRARELLQEAGWVDTNGDGIVERDREEFRVTMHLAGGWVGRWPYKTIAEVMQADLREVGIIMDIEVVDTGLWREMMERGEVEMTLIPIAGMSPRSAVRDTFHSEGGMTVATNPPFFSHPRIDELTEAAMKETDDAKAQRLLFEVQEIVAQDVLMIPLFEEVMINAVRDNIRGYKLHPWFTVNWEDIYVVAP
ncbi:ABC transporter substrate-binding protein [Dehalococcoidia bacterium]|nr:ABC transporter substrate-binding protein [Dehalococcoidia bacterium]